MYSLYIQGDKIKADRSGNKHLAISLSQWVFGERGQLRARDVTHRKEGESTSTNTYTITDNVVSIHN